MNKHSPLNYAFSVGKIRALEKFLIKQEVFEEAVDSGLFESLKLFVEADLYSEELLHIKNSQQLEAALNQELLKTKKLIYNLILDKNLTVLLELKKITQAKELLKAHYSDFLNDYINYLIDMHNIKTFLRLYALKEPIDKLKIGLDCEGFIKKGFFLKLYPQDISAFINRLEYVHKGSRLINYASYLGEAIKRIEKEGSFVSLEKAINNFLIQALKPAKLISFGPEPLIAYYLAKVNEINLIRMIILAKLNNVSSNLVKERLNDCYG